MSLTRQIATYLLEADSNKYAPDMVDEEVFDLLVAEGRPQTEANDIAHAAAAIAGFIEPPEDIEYEYRFERYTVYQPEHNLTFIMQDKWLGDDIKSSECIGWYHGEPNEECTAKYATRDMLAIYDL